MAETLTLSVRSLLKLHEALNSLDGSRTGKDEVIPFEFSPAVSWNLSKNAAIVEREKLVFDRALRQQAKQAGIAPGESIRVGPGEKPDPVKLQKFGELHEKTEELKDGEVTLTGILFIKMSDLLKRPKSGDREEGTNPIPQGVRNGLVPIIKEEGA